MRHEQLKVDLMRNFIVSEILRPASRRVGTALAGLVLGALSAQVDPSQLEVLSGVIASGILALSDLVLSAKARR